MAFKNYALMRKTSGKTKLVSLMQTLKATTSGFKFFCVQGKPFTSILKVIPTPLDAKVTILADGFSQVDNSIIVSVGTSINIKVEKDGYVPYETTIVANEQDYILEISLDKISTFKFVVDTTENPDNLEDNTFIIPFTAGTYTTLVNDPLTISWGDGSETIISDGIITKDLCKHTYETPGRYDITIETYSGTMPLISFGENYDDIENNKLKLVSISTSLLKAIDTNGVHNKLYNLFNGCRNLSFIPSDLFKYNNQLIDLKSCFEDCVKLTHLSNSLMLYIPNLENASNMFKNCDRIKQIPTGFLKANSKLVNCYRMFYDCDALETTPNNLFSACKNVNNYEECFYGCEKLTYNPLIFGSDFSYLGDVENINFANMFYRERFIGTNIGTAPEIWNVVVAPLEHTQGCFGEYMCNETLSNYWRIPFEWGGAERIEVAMDIDPTDLNTILYNYDLFELPYYKDEGWKRAQVKPTPSDADVNIVHTLNGYPTDYNHNVLYASLPGIIDNNLVYNFSSGNYLTETFTADLKSADNWEIEFKCTIGTLQSKMQLLVSSNTKNYDFVIGITASNKFGLWLSSNGTSQNLINGTNGSHTLQNGETYYVKCEFTGSAYTLYLKKNKDDAYEKDVSLTSSTKIYSGASMRIGTWIGGTSYIWNGSIDLNEMTVKRNGTIIWNGNKYTKVGFWNDNNKVGPFTSANYGLVPYLPNGTINSFEYKAKITTGSNITAQQGIFANSATNQANSQLIITTSSKFRFDTALNASTWGTAVDSTVAVKANTTYWIICGWRNGQSYIQVSTDGINYETPVTVANATCHWVEYLGIGIDGTNLPFYGTIDLKESYIKVNDKIVWDIYTHEYKYWDTVYKQNEIINGSQGIVKNGVASRFNTGSYLKLPNNFSDLNTTNWEMGFKYTTGDDVITAAPIIASLTSQCFNWVIENGKTQNNIGTGSAWLIDDGVSNYGSTDIQANTTYWTKVTFDGSSIKLYLSLDGETYWLDWSYATTQKITSCEAILGQRRALDATNFLKEIDLNESYIKVNGELWWDGSEYTTVGFWNDESKLIGISGTNYIQVPQTFNPGTTPWEFVVKFNPGATVSNTKYPFGCTNGNNSILFGWASGVVALWISSNGTSWNIASQTKTGSYSLVANTDYYAKVLFNGKFYELLMSTDGHHWKYGTKVASTVAIKACNFFLGAAWDKANSCLASDGYIDLNETYININGQRWWDCQSKDRTKYVTTIDDKEFLTLPNKEILVNVAKEGYDDYVNYHTFNSDTVLTPTLTQSSEI